ncbi:hypothetical protein D3C73_1448610 [compost metagenome]
MHLFMYKQIIWCYAGLSSIEVFTTYNTLSRKLQIRILVNNNRAFASQFQRNRSQMFSSSFHDDASNTRATRKENIIKMFV